MRISTYVIAALSVVCIISCACNSRVDSSHLADSTAVKSGEYVAYIDQNAFRTKLYDYAAVTPKYKGKRPALVDVYTTWCGPCKKVAPILDEIAKEYGDRIDFYRFDAEKEIEASAGLKVKGYPTILFFVPNEPVYVMLGAPSNKRDLLQIIKDKLLQQ